MKNITSLQEQEIQTRHGFSDTHKVVQVNYIDEKGRPTFYVLDLRFAENVELYYTYKFILKLKK